MSVNNNSNVFDIATAAQASAQRAGHAPVRDPEVAAAIARFFAETGRSDSALQDVHRAMRLLDRDAADLLVLHHCLGVSIDSAAQWFDLDERVAVGLLAQAEAAIAPVINV